MPTTYNLAPIPYWDVLDKVGKLASNGTITTYRDTARSELKATYMDPAGLIPHLNPIQLNATGSVGPIYWASDENYFIIIKDSAGS